MLQVTDKGITVDSLDDVISRLTDSFKAVYGEDINLDSDTPDGQMLGIFAQELTNIHESIAFIVKMLDPYQATGKWLEQRALYAGVIRNTASYSYVDDVVILGNPNTNLPSNMTFTDKDNQKWVITEQSILNELGSARVKLRSSELGNYTIKSGDELSLDTVIIGITQVKAESDSYGGADEETDAQLLSRFMLSHSINNHDDRKGIKSDLLEVVGVTQAEVYENYTGVTDEKGVPAHSINAVVIGGSDEDIAKSLTINKIGGCGLYGQIKSSYYYKDDERIVYFDRASKVPLSVVILIERINNFDDINTDEIKSNLKGINFNIGENVYATRLISYVNLTDGFYVQSIKINGNDIAEIGYREYAQIDEVEVNIDI